MIDTLLAPDGTISPARADEGGSGRAGGAVPTPQHYELAASRCLARTVPDGDCLIWQGAVNSSGTAMASVRKHVMPVARIVWHAAHGEFPPFSLTRTCGKSLCINLDHLKALVPRSVEDRLWEKVDAFGPMHPYDASLGRCWLWTGARYPTGYGHIYAPQFGGYAHRAAYGIANNCVPKLFILHSCDTPACCNPAHLREGTPADNVADRDARGRSNWQRRKEQS